MFVPSLAGKGSATDMANAAINNLYSPNNYRIENENVE